MVREWDQGLVDRLVNKVAVSHWCPHVITALTTQNHSCTAFTCCQFRDVVFFAIIFHYCDEKVLFFCENDDVLILLPSYMYILV